MKVGFGLVVLLGLLVVAPAAWACKCGFASEQELEQHYLVFAGRAVEYLEREDDGAASGPRVNAAVRFEVDRALGAELGSSIVVAMDIYTSCSTWFEVGQRHLVVARRLAGLVYATECPMVSGEVNEVVKRKLGLADDYFVARASPVDSALGTCQRPATLEAAVQRASAVALYRPKASCVVPGNDLIEHAALVTLGFKGLKRGELVRLRVAPLARQFAQEAERVWPLLRGTSFGWPPANFLRREGDTWIDDGCLIPMPPTSREAIVEPLTRLLAVPPGYRRDPFERPLGPRPALTCATLDAGFFRDADAALARHAHAQEVESYYESRRPRVAPDASGCASCSVASARSRPLAWLALLLTLLARGWRRASA